MPVAPDTTLKTYVDEQTGKYGSSWWYFQPGENYDQWRIRLENQYNADVANYQNYLQTMQFKKSDLQAAGYNPNYTDHTGMSPAGPGSYSTPDQTDSFAPLNRFLSIAGQASGISSQAVGSIMGVLTGLNQMDKNNMDIHSKSLANQVTSLGLWKLAGQLFGSDNISDVMQWLSGGAVDIDFKKFPGGPVQWLSSLFQKGPLMSGLSKSLNLTDEKINSLIQGTAKTAAEIPGIEAKGKTSEAESDMYVGNKILMWLAALARAVSSFL